MLITLGTIVIIMSLWGMTHGDSGQKLAGVRETSLPTMRHMKKCGHYILMPLGVMAIITALIVTGKGLAKIVMFAPLVLVNMLGGMLILTSDNGYGGTPTGVSAALAGLMMLTTILTCASGFMHKGDTEESGD